ncbi:MAG: amidohydrolase family protein [Gemmatimonadales bacterium]|jgi:imidazolonepropionase-like amidohydrolase
MHRRTDARGFVLAAALLVAGTPALHAQTATGLAASARGWAIRNVTIVPVTGPRIERGTVVIRNGKIEAVGASAAPQPGDSVLDGSGLFVYPGMIDAGTRLGLSEINSVPGGEDLQELGEFNPQDAALIAVNPNSTPIPVTRSNGVTTAITSPRGGLVSGQAALLDLLGWTPQEMAVRAPAAMVMTYPSTGGGGRFRRARQAPGDQTNRQVLALKAFLGDAKAYADIKARLAAGAPGSQKTDLGMEAMVPVMRGDEPVIFDVETAQQIRGVLALADSFGLKVILRGAHEAWQLADTLAARHIPVIVGPTTTGVAPDDPYDEIYANPGVLAKAGVTIAFQTNDAHSSRDLPYNAALAEAYGLPADDALKALTINAAQIFGVADRLGSIEPGKEATLIVTDGDPLDARYGPKYVFIRGELVPFNDRHTVLYEEFRARPKP